MQVKTINIWGAITTCDDKIIIEEVIDQDSNQTYYTVCEKSYEMQDTYVYTTLPPVLDKLINYCNAIVQLQDNNLVLYGPHLSKKLKKIPIYQYPLDYLSQIRTINNVQEDKKMRQFLVWLETLMEIMET